MTGTSESVRKSWERRRHPDVYVRASDGDGMALVVEYRGASYEIVFDAADREVVAKHKWSIHPAANGSLHYATAKMRSGRRDQVALHRLITKAKRGMSVDHINGNGLDNRRKNLRVCTHAENMFNRKLRSDNTTGFRGVSARTTRTGKVRFVVKISAYGKERFIGTFDTLGEAVLAYKEQAVKLHGSFSRDDGALRSGTHG